MITNLANKWAKKLVENGANAGFMIGVCSADVYLVPVFCILCHLTAFQP